MIIDVCLVPQEINEERSKDKFIIVIDVLRASSTILTALENGCRYVIPTATVSDAMEIAQQFDRDSILLCGEREGKKIAGFDLGNSPLEYIKEKVEGKILIFSSTNGSKTLLKVHNAKSIFIATFNNIDAVAQHIRILSNDVMIVCSGKLDRFALEDAVCAGMVVSQIMKVKNGWELTDGAVAALNLSESFTDTLDLLLNCQHGKYLTSIGMKEDLHLCSQLNTYTIVPEFTNGKIVKRNTEAT